MATRIMDMIKSGSLRMKPKWYFVLGSLAVTGGMVGLFIFSIFLVSLITFSLRSHGPMGSIRYEQLTSNFPWWAVVMAIVGVGFGVWLLKKYDFSYKKNLLSVTVSFVLVILFSGWLINYFGFDGIWIKRGLMRGFYQRYDGGMMRVPGWRMMQKFDGLRIDPEGVSPRFLETLPLNQ